MHTFAYVVHTLSVECRAVFLGGTLCRFPEFWNPGIPGILDCWAVGFLNPVGVEPWGTSEMHPKGVPAIRICWWCPSIPKEPKDIPEYK